MGLKKNSLATAVGLQTPLHLKTVVMSITNGGGVNTTVLAATPAGKIRRVLTGFLYTAAYNNDGVPHLLQWRVNGTNLSALVNVDVAESFPLDGSLVLNAGDVLSLYNDEGAGSPIVATVVYTEDDAVGASFGGDLVTVDSTTPVTLVPAPPTGKVRTVLLSEGVFGGVRIYNPDVSDHTVTFRIGSTVVDTREVATTLTGSPNRTVALSGSQTFVGLLEGAAATPVVILVAWEDYYAAP